MHKAITFNILRPGKKIEAANGQRVRGMRYLVLVILAFGGVGTAVAGAYKCTNAEGRISYSQIPCATTGGQQQKLLSYGGGSAASAGMANSESACAEVAYVATYIEDALRGGHDAQSLIARHGGINGINPHLLSLINYVNGFRYDETITSARISDLAVTKCKGGGFGQLQVGDLPIVDETQEIARARQTNREQALIAMQAQVVSVDYRDTPLASALEDLSARAGVEIVLEEPSPARVTMQLANVPWQQVLSGILLTHNLQMRPVGKRLYISAAPH